MKSTPRSRRHRNPPTPEGEQQKPFFPKSNTLVQTKEDQPFFQPKLTIGQPGDQYEREADAVADQVVNGQNQQPVVQRQEISSIQRESFIDMFSEDIGANDYRIPNLHLDANRYLASVKASLKAGGLSQVTIDQAFGQANNPFADKPIMNLYEIRPDKKLEEGGPGGLTFDPTKMKGMLDKGMKRAKAFFESLPVPPFV